MKLAELAGTRIQLHPTAWRGASAALRFVGWSIAVVVSFDLALRHFAWERALGVGLGISVAILAALLGLLLVRAVRRGPLDFWWGLLLTTATLGITYAVVVSPQGFAALLGAVLGSTITLGGGLAMLRSHGFTWPRAIAAGVGGIGLAALAVALVLPGWTLHRSKTWQPQRVAALDLPNPGLPGPLPIHTLTYGSGSDPHRTEYGTGADLVTKPVDGSRLIEGWSGPAGWARTQYWGFDAKQLPRQGRVWFPDGAGPFPLVLMVHGNHNMEEFSDAGYAYLGELFASRGNIAVSVDENFLNSSFADLLGGFSGGLEKENDARGWLLLEHLRLWREWNQTPGHPFHGKVDLDRIVLIGHSRGGEAVAVAALFNRLPFYPDDARVAFDYRFALRGVIAIAPSDAQYLPRSRPTAFRDLSYLVVQGSNDGDVQSYMGSAQYSRIKFDSCKDCFKAGLYLVGANHGQFNTDWGRDDLGDAWGQMLNLTPIIDASAQRRVAEVLFSAFLEVVFNGHNEYRNFLANPATGLAWLGPDVEFVNQYSAAGDASIADFEEDDDVTTGSAPGAHITGVELARWHEIQIPLKWEDLDSVAALLAWNRTGDRPVPELRIDLNGPRTAASQLNFSLAMSETSPLDAEADWKTPDSIDFHIVLTDHSGHESTIALSSVQPLYAPINVSTRKLALLDPVDPSEPVFQRYSIPLVRFEGFDPTNLTAITLRFDVTSAGALYLDDVSLASTSTSVGATD